MRNPYAYASGNPVMNVDPEGEHVEVLVGRFHLWVGYHKKLTIWDHHFMKTRSEAAYTFGKIGLIASGPGGALTVGVTGDFVATPKARDRRWHMLNSMGNFHARGRKRPPKYATMRHRNGFHFDTAKYINPNRFRLRRK